MPARRRRGLAPLSLALLTAAGLAAWNAVASWRAEAKNPPPGRLLYTRFGRVHLVEGGAGAGAPALFLHGNLVHGRDWELAGVFTLAGRTRPVLAIDRPGYGWSTRPRGRLATPERQAEALAALLDRLAVGPAIIVAHSVATQSALALAAQRPDLVRALVLLSGYYFPTPRPDAAMVAPAAWPVVGDLLRWTLAPVTGRVLAGPTERAMFAPNRPPPAFHDRMIPMSVRPSQIAAEGEDGAAMPGAARRLERLYTAIEAPAVIVAGSEDRIVDWRTQSERLSQALPNAELMRLEGLGHMVHYAAPEAVVSAIERADALGEAAGAPSAAAQAPAFSGA